MTHEQIREVGALAQPLAGTGEDDLVGLLVSLRTDGARGPDEAETAARLDTARPRARSRHRVDARHAAGLP